MEPHQTNEASYWNSVAMAGLLFGLIVFAVNIIGGYMTIQTESADTLMAESMIAGLLSCLIGAFGGLMAVKYYVKEYPQPLLIGRGAVIGLATGVVIALVFSVLSLLWNVIDPAYTENLMESTIANIEAMGLNEAQQQDMIDSIAEQMQQMQTTGGVLMAFGMNALLYGILNLLTGMLGVKFFAPHED
ncbi:MAG: DUF4199 domain-containing protein [Balneolales bacterium]